MKILNTNIIVSFLTDHNFKIGIGLNGIDIVQPSVFESDDHIAKNEEAERLIKKTFDLNEELKKSFNANAEYKRELEHELVMATFEAKEAINEREEATTRFDENNNLLHSKPQICVVKHPNAHLEYNVGDKLFVHYMAWECAELTEYGHVIDTDFIFFKINEDETFDLVESTYLGEAIYSKEEVTTSGIILLEGKKDNLRVKITHLPDNNTTINIGDIVVSVDKNNYEFDYWGKKYIKLTADEIAGVIFESNLKPLALI